MASSAWGLRCAALALAGLGGVAWQLGWEHLPQTTTLLALALSAAAVLAWAAHKRRLLVACVALALIAAALTGLRAEQRLAGRLAPALEGVDLELTGVIVSLPQRQADAQRFVFEVEVARLQGRPVTVPRRVWLVWFRGAQDDPLLLGPDTALAAGQRWRFATRLRLPHGLANPHGFDFELWLFERDLGATGVVRANAQRPAELLRADAARPIERARQRLSDAIAAQVPDTRAAGVLAALAVGDQSAIDRDDWDRFRDTGVAHLMSISGLHVTMFAWLAQAVVGALWRRSRRLVLRLPTPLAARWGGLAAATAYALLAGWGVPAQRTLWMLATAALLASSSRRWPWPLVLLAAAVVVAAIDPWALLQPGFWLSFVAVGLLLIGVPVQRIAPGTAWAQRAWQAVSGGLRTQVVATLGLAPLTLLFFQQVSLVGFVANLVAIPLVTLLITPLALLGALWAPLWSLGAALVQAMSVLLGWLDGPHAVWSAAAAPLWAQALGMLGGVLAVAPLPARLRIVCVPLLLLPMLVPTIPAPASGQVEIVALDVGQGSAVLVRTHSRLLVYDAGPQFGQADAGQRVLLPLLRARGERRIDLLVLSHGDSDHIGGAASLLAALPVAQLASSLPFDHPLLRAAAVPRRCIAGDRWVWDGVAFEWLHPQPAHYAGRSTPNMLSCVLRVTDAAGRSVLLAGDIEAAQESALLARPDVLRADVLLVPHHGSRTSSSEGFVAAVAPRFAVVQAGYRNRYGHPVPEVTQRYAAAGSAIVRSDVCGAWRWSDGMALCERERRRRYWHHQMP